MHTRPCLGVNRIFRSPSWTQPKIEVEIYFLTIGRRDLTMDQVHLVRIFCKMFKLIIFSVLVSKTHPSLVISVHCFRLRHVLIISDDMPFVNKCAFSLSQFIFVAYFITSFTLITCFPYNLYFQKDKRRKY